MDKLPSGKRAIERTGKSGETTHPLSAKTDERWRVKGRLAAEEAFARVTLQSIADGVITTNAEGRVNFLNLVAEQLTGWHTEEARGLPIEKILPLFHEKTRQPVNRNEAEYLNGDRPGGRETHKLLVNRYGKGIVIEDSAAPIDNADGMVVGMVRVFHDVTNARLMADQLSFQATHDTLTGLENRAELEHRLQQSLRETITDHAENAFLFMDLDQFKLVNDTSGHIAGDELLRQLAVLLKEQVRRHDTLARIGGDEFGLLLRDCPLAKAESIAQDLIRMVQAFRYVWKDKTFSLGLSIGLVKLEPSFEGPEAILSMADTACYMAKEQGRNQVHSYHPDHSEAAVRHGQMHLVTQIRQAIDEDRLTLHVQRILSLRSEDANQQYYEVLVRMLDEEGRLVPPLQFIPAAGRYNLMPVIDRWVISRLLSTWAQTCKSGTNMWKRVFAINLSGTSLNDSRFLEFVRDELHGHQVPEGHICFEITETAAVANLARAIHFMKELKKLGCRFSLDDFGSGLSSFAYLKNLPVDCIKIDGAFVRDLDGDPVNAVMVESIQRMAKVMGLRTVAEYVENQNILSRVREIGIDYAQGFGIERPHPLTELLERPAPPAAVPSDSEVYASAI